VLFFVGHYSAVSGAFILAPFAIGVATFAVPYWAFRSILDGVHDEMCGALTQRVAKGNRPDFKRVDLLDFTAANAAIVADPPPVFSRRGAVTYLTVQVAAFVAVVGKDLIQELVGDAVTDGDGR
jgi:hypothetical protein